MILETEQGDLGYGLIFTIGRGNNICCTAIESLEHLIVGKDLGDITANIGGFYDSIRSDTQLRWLGPEKGVVHMAVGCVVNAVWDMWARVAGKPLWQLVSDMSPEQFVDSLDFKHISDALTREEALAIVKANAATKKARIKHLKTHGYPAYTTSAGWLGYDDAKLKRLCSEAIEHGFTHLKI